MNKLHLVVGSRSGRLVRLGRLGLAAAALWVLVPQTAGAVPLYMRQTGQNCVACHAGGQFPELTPFGRQFKLTGYTLGQRTVPVSAMAVASASHVANTSKSDTPEADFQKNNQALVATVSLFLGGKITDKLGAFAQITYDPYATQSDDGRFHGHSNADNIDIRYADRISREKQDLIWGVSLNNNPSLADPWNTAPAWMQYVPVPSPTSSRFIDGNTPYPGYAAGGNLAGVSAYAYLNDSWYAELGGYGSARGLMSFMAAGLADADRTKLRGINPYWRLAWTHAWGEHNLMLGAGGMRASVYDDPLDTSDPASTHRFRDWNLDAQYQYLSEPHTVTAQFVWGHNHHRYPAALAGENSAFVSAVGAPLAPSNAVDTSRLLRTKLSYVYQAHYGGSLSLFDVSGTANTANQTSGYSPDSLSITSSADAAAPSVRVDGNLAGRPDTRGHTFELFWTPIEYLRVGAQYTAYSRFNGAAHNYDGFGRNASDNNSLFFYAWAAY